MYSLHVQKSIDKLFINQIFVFKILFDTLLLYIVLLFVYIEINVIDITDNFAIGLDRVQI